MLIPKKILYLRPQEIDSQNNPSRQQNDEYELMKEFASFKQNNPNASLKDFYVYLAKKIKEEESDD